MDKTDKTKDLSDFYADLCKDRRVKSALRDQFGHRVNDVLKKLRAGKLDGDDLVGHAESIIQDLVHNEATEVWQMLAAAPYEDTFPIIVMKFRKVYWVRAPEFEDIGYFDNQQEAERCAFRDIFA